MNTRIALLACSALLLASCATVNKTAKTAEVTSQIHSAAVADLMVKDRVTTSMDVTKEVRRGGLDNVKHAAEAKALEENGNADVLLEPQYVIEKRRGLFTSKVTHITVSGRPAFYKNFRTLDDSVWNNATFRGIRPIVVHSGAAATTKKHAYTFASGPYRKSRITGFATLTGGYTWSTLHTRYSEEDDQNQGNISGELSIGYQINPHWFAGIGCGLGYAGSGTTDLDAPVFLQARYYFTENRRTWFADGKVGHVFSDGNDGVSNGFFQAFSLGYSWGRFEMSLQYRHTKYERGDDSYYTKGANPSSLNLALGFRI